jgi:hypothetical protein
VLHSNVLTGALLLLLLLLLLVVGRPQGLYPFVSGAVSSVLPLADLAYIAYAHFEGDECGAMNLFLEAVGGLPGGGGGGGGRRGGQGRVVECTAAALGLSGGALVCMHKAMC